MSFTFGQPAPGPAGGAPSFGFGAPSAPTAAVAPSAFGGFGAPASNALSNTPAAFGGGFGTTTPAFGGGFGGAPAPAFGSSFGTSAITSTAQPPAFGGFGTTSSAPSAFGGFGQTTTMSTAPAFGGFGTTVSAAPPAFGGFGATTSTAPAFGGFGSSVATSTAPAFGGFGSAATSTVPTFGAFGASTTNTMPVSSTTSFGAFGGGGSTGMFGAPTTSVSSFGGFGSTGGVGGGGMGAFGSGLPGAGTTSFGGFGAGSSFGSRPGGLTFGGAATTSSFAPAYGGFGTNTFAAAPQPQGFGAASTFGSFGAPPQQLQQQQQFSMGATINPVEQLYNSVLQCSVFGDERDSLLARWNMLQASWGIGKAFFSTSLPALDLSAENPLCRFKTIGYSALPSSKNEDGLMSAIVRKKSTDLASQKMQIASSILVVLGNRPNFKVNIDEIRSAGPDVSELAFHVQETNPQNGQSRKVFTSEIAPFLSQPAQVQNLQQLGLEFVVPKVAFTEEQIKDYLDQPPQGIDPRLWKQAQLDNPDPKTLIPVPMIGFRALQQRIQCQDQQARTFKSRLNAINDEISDLQKRHQDTVAKLREAKRRQLALSHRVLHVLVKQEETRKIGFTIQPEEEKLRVQLEALQAEMSAPTQFKGRLNELLAKVRLQSQASAMSCGGGGSGGEKRALDPFLQQDIKNVLKQQQQGIQALISLMKEDIADLNVMTELTSESNQKR